MRSPLWMVPYVLVLLFSGASYAALVFLGVRIALLLALAAFVAAIVSLVLVIKR